MHTAILLAAGLGRGAWPYSGLRQKVTLPVAQTPIIRRLALQLCDLGMKEILIVVGHGAGAVRACTTDIPGVRFCEQSARTGCGDAALVGLTMTDADRVLICCGDIVTGMGNLKTLTATKSDAGAVLLGVPTPPGLAVWDSIDVDAAGVVSGVWNKGARRLPRFGGAVVAEARLLRETLEQSPGYVDNVGVGAMPPAENNLAAALNRLCARGQAVACVLGDEFLVDVNRPWDLVEANQRANAALFAERRGMVAAENASIHESADIPAGATILLGDGARIGKRVIVEGDLILGPNAQAISGAILGARAHLGAYSVVREYARVHDNAIVGAHNVLGHCAEFAGVSFEHVLLWHYCCITAVIGAHTDIGAATCCGTWRFDDTVREQRIDTHYERPPYHGGMTFLGDRVRTGVNAVINPGVRVGQHSCIGPGVILYDDVQDGQLVLAKQEQVIKPWGPERYCW